MKHFWQGFEKASSSVQFKRHVIVLYWEPTDDAARAKEAVQKIAVKYPTVKIKQICVSKDPTRPHKHRVDKFPTVLLLKDGREVDRVVDMSNKTLLEHLFRRASV